MSSIQRVVTSGTFELDGGSWDVDNNIWLVGDDNEVIVIDAAHNAQAIEDAVAGRHVVAVICTHGHNDHITVAPQLSADLDAPVFLNPADDMLWRTTHGDTPFRAIEDGQVFTADGVLISENAAVPRPNKVRSFGGPPRGSFAMRITARKSFR